MVEQSENENERKNWRQTIFIGFHLKIDTPARLQTPMMPQQLRLLQRQQLSNTTNQQQLLDEYDEHKPASKQQKKMVIRLCSRSGLQSEVLDARTDIGIDYLKWHH